MKKSSPTPDRPKGSVKNLWPLLRYLKPYRVQVAAATVALVFTSSAVLAMGAGLRYLVDEGLSKGNTHLLDKAFLILLTVTLLLAAASYVRYYLVSWIGERAVADIRSDVYRHVMSMHIGFFETMRTGELLSRITTDTTLLQTVIGSSVSVAVRNALMLVGGIILLLVTSAQLTGYVFMMIPLVIVPIVVLGRRVRLFARDAQSKVADISAHAEESLNAVRTLQSFTLEDYDRARFESHVSAATKAAQSRIRARAFLTAIVITLMFGAIVTVLWFGGKDVLAGRITAGDLSAFVFYSIVVAGAVGAISEVVADLQRAAGAAERLSELLAMRPEIISHPAAIVSAPIDGADVRFDKVSFAYPARSHTYALNNLSLDIKAGETVAIVGPSGAGKTTIFQLLLRFYDVSGGSISIAGRNIRDYALHDLRGMIGIVPQEPVIFSGSVRDNILLGNITADNAAIVEAARAASALEFIDKLPQGFNTQVGEKGIQLSGGQRQRLAIARAILRNPKLLLLDEATSALDSENEQLIQDALTHIMKDRTTFVIAHRLSTVMQADRIVLLNEGVIEAVGTHAELLKISPLYQRLVSLQFRQAA